MGEGILSPPELSAWTCNIPQVLLHLRYEFICFIDLRLSSPRNSLCMQEEAQGNADRVPLIIRAAIKSLQSNSVVIDRDYWLKVDLAFARTQMSPWHK